MGRNQTEACSEREFHPALSPNPLGARKLTTKTWDGSNGFGIKPLQRRGQRELSQAVAKDEQKDLHVFLRVRINLQKWWLCGRKSLFPLKCNACPQCEVVEAPVATSHEHARSMLTCSRMVRSVWLSCPSKDPQQPNPWQHLLLLLLPVCCLCPALHGPMRS